jgi:hypothetical protein
MIKNLLAQNQVVFWCFFEAKCTLELELFGDVLVVFWWEKTMEIRGKLVKFSMFDHKKHKNYCSFLAINGGLYFITIELKISFNLLLSRLYLMFFDSKPKCCVDSN